MAKLAGWEDSILFTKYNQRLRTYRKLLHQTFNPRATMDFQDLQKNEVHKLMKRLSDTPRAFMQHAHLMAGSVAIRIAYGHRVNDSNDEFIRSAEEFMAAVGEATIPGRWMVETIPLLRFVPSWMPGAGFKRWTNEWAKKTVKHRQAPFDSAVKKIAEGTAEPSFISKLLDSEDSAQVITAEQKDIIKVIASSLYGAGADTTSSVLQFFFLAMTLYPDVQAKAQTEIDDYLGYNSGKPARLLTMADRENLPYTRAVISEALRWHPVLNLAVHNTESGEEFASGYRIPGNTMVIANIWAILHDPTVYINPNEFCPDRYFGDEPAPDPAPYAFGFGRRVCPGLHIAQQSLWLSVSNLLANFSVSKAQAADGTQITPKDSFTNDVLSIYVAILNLLSVQSVCGQLLLKG
ncbi:hypothetical protein FRC09_001388 [Ceratobasidium sp. 395]|nr:hypothetical protein FRC09_001388 [Ceratobasidium sp. 395]